MNYQVLSTKQLTLKNNIFGLLAIFILLAICRVNISHSSVQDRLDVRIVITREGVVLLTIRARSISLH